MKKLFTILAIIILAISISSCATSDVNPGGSSENPGSSESSEENPGEGEASPASEAKPPEAAEEFLEITEDSYLMSMQITPPTEFKTVERFFEFGEDGGLTDKTLIYTLPNDSVISYAYVKDTPIENVINTSKSDFVDAAGKQFYRYDYESSYMAFCQIDKDLYGLNYQTETDEDADAFVENLTQNLKFTGRTTTSIDDKDLYGISYTIDDSIPMYSHTLSVVADQEGNTIRKSLLFRFGESEDKMLYRFLVRVFKNVTIEDIKSAEIEYEERTIGDLTYTVEVPEDEDEPFAYYIANGSDVYLIKNNGTLNDLSQVRSEESIQAFQAFLETISFEQKE